jgi:hypothetical protein
MLYFTQENIIIIREYGATDEVAENALFAGVIDGPSFSG